MGLGPGTALTTLHHYHCPVTRHIMADPDVDFAGIVISGISENYDDKLASAEAAGNMLQQMKTDGVLIEIDGWGNHHVDFVSVFEAVGERGIPAVGLSYLGQQGRLVCSNSYVGPVIDFNKSPRGYESCILGENFPDETDAWKALGLLKHRMPRYRTDTVRHRCGLNRYTLPVKDAVLDTSACRSRYDTERKTLTLNPCIEEDLINRYPRLQRIKLSLIRQEERHQHINTILDCQPIARKVQGCIGEGDTVELGGIVVLLTGAEAETGLQPANIGSSDGYLDEHVAFNRVGTPRDSDLILHVDCILCPGESRTSEGIQQAHLAADRILQDIRDGIPDPVQCSSATCIRYRCCERPGKPRAALVKMVSGLGAMYDTAVFPNQPGGMDGAVQMRSRRNMPLRITPTQCLDGAIHTLV